MLHGAQRGLFELTFGLPAECADRLKSGEADIGIVPTIEVARQALEILPGTGIASRGAVRSILLVSRVAPEAIRTLAADTSSRTSVMLARVILSGRFGAEPRFVPLAPPLETMLEGADAALIIGDPALRVWLNPPAGCRILDLGAEWTEWTGLPMVFAVWAGRRECVGAEVARAFQESCRFGLARIDEIARLEGPPRGLPEAFAREYLTRHIVLELGDEEYRGMREFLARARPFDMLASTGGSPA